MENWQKNIIKKEETLTTNQLLDEVIFAAVPDDYDGLHSKIGDWEFMYLKKKLYTRLNFTLPET